VVISFPGLTGAPSDLGAEIGCGGIIPGSNRGFNFGELQVGQVVQMSYQLELNARADSDPLGGIARTQADFSRTLRVFFTPLTPGASYVASNGVDYTFRESGPEPPTPVPEPTTFTLVGMCLAGLAARFARKRFHL